MSEFVARRLFGLATVGQGLAILLTPFKPKWQMKAAKRLARAKAVSGE